MLYPVVPSGSGLVPILENFLFELADGTLTVTASDYQTTVIGEVQVDGQENGSVCVPAKMLMETLKNLPEQPIVFSLEKTGSYVVEVKVDNGKYRLTGENPEDFPRVPPLDRPEQLDIPRSYYYYAFCYQY